MWPTVDQLYYYEKLFIIHLGGIGISFLDGTWMMKSTVLKRLELVGREHIKCDRWNKHGGLSRWKMFVSGKKTGTGLVDQQVGYSILVSLHKQE